MVKKKRCFPGTSELSSLHMANAHARGYIKGADNAEAIKELCAKCTVRLRLRM